MTPEEQLRNTATRLDELLELKSRTHCLDELYSFAIGRLHYYRGKNAGKTIPSLLDGFDEDGQFREELFHYSMERQYLLFSDYILSCMKDMGKDFENLNRQMREMKEKDGNKPKSSLTNVKTKGNSKNYSMLTIL